MDNNTAVTLNVEIKSDENISYEVVANSILGKTFESYESLKFYLKSCDVAEDAIEIIPINDFTRAWNKDALNYDDCAMAIVTVKDTRKKLTEEQKAIVNKFLSSWSEVVDIWDDADFNSLGDYPLEKCFHETLHEFYDFFDEVR